MPLNNNTFTDKFSGQPRTSSFQSPIFFLLHKSLDGSMEAEAEAVGGRLEEAEVKEKLTAVASLLSLPKMYSLVFS